MNRLGFDVADGEIVGLQGSVIGASGSAIVGFLGDEFVSFLGPPPTDRVSGSITVEAVTEPAGPLLPTLSLIAAPTSVVFNGTTTLSWSANNVTACVASGGWAGARAISGSEVVGPLTSDRTFTLTCSGPTGNVTDSVLVTVANPVDPNPVVHDDVAETSQDTPVAIGVLANDTGLDDTPLTLSVVDAPQNGVASVTGFTILYVPDAEFVGQDSFAYLVQDADGDSAVGRVLISVTPF